MSLVADVKGEPVGPPLRLLIADDTAEVRQLLRMSFDLIDGFEVVAEADNGYDAVEQTVSLLPGRLGVGIIKVPTRGTCPGP